METNFKILGMTCDSCAHTVTEQLKTISNVDHVSVSLASNSATLHSSKSIELSEVKKALSAHPKYSVVPFDNSLNLKPPESKLKTYKPLIILFIFILLTSLAYQLSLDHFHLHLFMNHIMAGFFLGLAFFKFLDLNSFADSFSNYDPVAQKFLSYGRIYPFLELILGLLFVSGRALLAANTIAIALLSLTAIGVVKRLQSKSKFECACLGTTFSFPLSYVTVSENLVMITMALIGLMMN